MRTIRNSAVAGATALAVAFGGVSIASAQVNTDAEIDVTASLVGDAEPVEEPQGPKADEPAGDADSSLSSDINTGSSLEGEEPANGTAIFGSSKEGFADQPRWSQALYVSSVLGVLGSIIGLIVGPIHNFIVHGQ